MQSDEVPDPVHRTGTGLPRPRRGARWRWSTPRTTLVAGGVLATLWGLGAGGAAAGAATATAGPSNQAGASGQPRPGSARPTVVGRITARNGNGITVQTRRKKTTTVVYYAAAKFTTLSGPGGTTSASSASALEIGAFVAVQGTTNGDGSVMASSIVISTGPPPAGALGARPARRTVGRFP